jgi:hypothetical protein
MTDNNTGWPGGEFEGDAYNQHANVKLTQEQLDHITDSGEPISQWIRDAIQARIDREQNKKSFGLHVRPYHASTGLRSDGEWPK